MTQATPDIRGIEHLDHHPACDHERHNGAHVRATHWVNSHGCYEGFQCADCVQLHREYAKDGYWLVCSDCNRGFLTYEGFRTVVPL